MIIAGIVWALTGIVVIVAVEAPARGRLGINSLIGLRFGALMRSERAWVAGHRAALAYGWAAGISMIVGGLIVVLAPISSEEASYVFGGGAVILVIFLALAAGRAQRAASLQTHNDTARGNA